MNNRSHLFAAAFAITLALPTLASAQAPGHSFGLGLQLGDPGFAFSGKYFFDHSDAIQATLGWRTPYYYGARGPLVTVDWQHRVATVVPHSGRVHVGFDVGVGGAVGFVGNYCVHRYVGGEYCYDGGAELALRIPLAASFYFPSTRLEAYIELAPMLAVVPYFGPDFMGGVGGRFYF